jgi:hypothetical protein
MNLHRFCTALVVFVSCNAAQCLAQGMFEMGALHGDQAKNVVAPLGKKMGELYKHTGEALLKRLSPEQIQDYANQSSRDYNMAQEAFKAGNTAEGLKSLDRSISIRQKVWGDADPYLAELYAQEGASYRKLNRLPEAINAHQKQLLVETKKFGEFSPQAEKTIKLLAQLSDELGDDNKELVYTKLLCEIERRKNSQSKAAKDLVVKLAVSYTVASRYDEAEALLKDQINSQVSIKTPDKQFLARLYDAYGGLLRETERATEAAAMEQRAVELKAAQGNAAPAAAQETAQTAQ